MNDRTVDRVPLVLTYYPFNTQIKQFRLQNYRILSTDQQTRDILPQPPFAAHKRDLNVRNMLVHRTDHLCTEQCGSRSCQRPRCHTCPYASPETKIRGPKCYFSIRDHFTCQSSNLVYCISCNRCPTILYIGETGRSLRTRFGEHLLIRNENADGNGDAKTRKKTGERTPSWR